MVTVWIQRRKIDGAPYCPSAGGALGLREAQAPAAALRTAARRGLGADLEPRENCDIFAFIRGFSLLKHKHSLPGPGKLFLILE